MAKINNGTLFRMMTYFAAILFTAGCVYGVVHYRLNTVEANVKHIEDNEIPKIETDIDSCKDWMSDTGAELVGIKKDVGYLRKEIDENLLEQKTFQVEQRAMQTEILTKIEGLKK